jgi:hypothetical protein
MLPTPRLVAIAAGATSNQLVEDLSGVGLAEPEDQQPQRSDRHAASAARMMRDFPVHAACLDEGCANRERSDMVVISAGTIARRSRPPGHRSAGMTHHGTGLLPATSPGLVEW